MLSGLTWEGRRPLGAKCLGHVAGEEQRWDLRPYPPLSHGTPGPFQNRMSSALLCVGPALGTPSRTTR